MHTTVTVLPEAEWQARRTRHATRVRRWTEPLARRRADGERHPVLDFLFTYYSHRPSRLLRWHPGPGVVLGGPAAREYLRWPAYRETDAGVTLDVAAMPDTRRHTVEFVRTLLTATQDRTPWFGCFGLHEWAMVYRAAPQRRHESWPLRLRAEETDAVVESMPVRCTHFDAYRFFTPPARPLNTVRPTRERQVELEQPGCLHATMDFPN